MKKLVLRAGTLVCTIILVSCQAKSPETHLSYGPRTATGTLLKAEVSLVRRGTHLLRLPDGEKLYVESRTTNLSEFEGQMIVVSGSIEANIEGELPVLVADSVRRITGSDGLKRWEIPALNLMIRTPETWKGAIEKNIARFALEGEERSLLLVRLYSGSSLPPGNSFYIRNRRATRTDPDESVVQEVYILEKGTVIALQFDPSSQRAVTNPDEAELLEAQFEQVLSDLTFLSDQKGREIQAGSGSSMMPCGGIAGILCPTGSYCDITDPEAGVGRCRNR